MHLPARHGAGRVGLWFAGGVDSTACDGAWHSGDAAGVVGAGDVYNQRACFRRRTAAAARTEGNGLGNRVSSDGADGYSVPAVVRRVWTPRADARPADGLLFAVNTAGTVLGSLLPIFVLVPMLGIQKSMMLISVLYGVMGLALLAAWRRGKPAAGSGGRPLSMRVALFVFFAIVPSNLCQRVFLATDFNLAKHTDILFYREGRTGTAIVTRDRVNNCKTVYINGVSEVPASLRPSALLQNDRRPGSNAAPKPGGGADDMLRRRRCRGGDDAAARGESISQSWTWKAAWWRRQSFFRRRTTGCWRTPRRMS